MAGRTALLTGASGGIGGALGERLVAAGVRVAFTYGAHSEQAERLVSLARSAGVDALALGADLADPDTPARLVEQVTAQLGPVDVLIPNAGTATMLEYADVDLATWDDTLAVNLRAPFLLAQAVLPGMVERGHGRVLFMSSVAAFTGGMIGPHYAASKAGLHGLVHFLAARVAAHGVTVNALAPALVEDTRMFPGAGPDVPIRIPVGRYGRPEEVADLAMAVLGNGYLTSQVIGLDGGAYPR
ncbi:SDR family NAD(P)-dependent oxidoreductase [Actinophytocola sp.]|uniref:SDR family NAD(P)-dependent oxidoreductase n=1 Tax=Actinophytocola sp. TaxID=1872138 RepID=UPI002EDAD61A